MFLRLSLFLLTVCLGFDLRAQTLDDVLRYSETQTFGTARSLGTGNSMGAIGADWTALQSNPAGLAAFRNNEFTFTLGAINPGSKDAVLSESETASSVTDQRYSVKLPQLALVLTNQPIASNWSQVNFGFGVSQIARFEENISFSGESPGSISDLWLDDGNFFTLDADGFIQTNPFQISPQVPSQLSPFSTGLALDAGVLRFANGNNSDNGYFTDYDDDRIFNNGSAFLRKEGQVNRDGYAASFDFSFAGNYREKLLVGATLGIVSSAFNESNSYTETDNRELVDRFGSLRFRQNFVTSGTGFHGRVGAIYRASQALRVGLAYHSPVLTSITDAYSTNLQYRYTNLAGENVEANAESPEASEIEYTIISPSQLRASLAGIIGKRGFVGAEVAYINYAGASVRIADEFDGQGFADDLNRRIDTTFRSNFQFNVGGELNLKTIMIRAGYEYLGTPFADFADGSSEPASYAITAGLGYRRGRFSVDGAYRLGRNPGRVYRPYTVIPLDFEQPEVEYTPFRNAIALTVGWKLVPRVAD